MTEQLATGEGGDHSLLERIDAHQQTLRQSWLEQVAAAGYPVRTESPIAADIRIASALCQQAGTQLAELHARYGEFQMIVENPYEINRMKNRVNFLNKDNSAHSQRHVIEQTLVYLSDRPPHPLPDGMTHGNYTPANVSVVGVFGWEYSCSDSYLYDLALALNAWSFDDIGTFRASWFNGFLGGYERVRPLKHNERRLFNYELRRAAVRECLRLCSKEEAAASVRAFEVLNFHNQRYELADYA